jgi:hypothetical protein
MASGANSFAEELLLAVIPPTSALEQKTSAAAPLLASSGDALLFAGLLLAFDAFGYFLRRFRGKYHETGRLASFANRSPARVTIVVLH